MTTEGGLFARVGETREIEGLLLPFGELSRPGNMTRDEPIMFDESAVTLPRDPSVVTLNNEHDRFEPLGRGVAFSMTPAGVRSRFAIADTEEGDAFLASYSEGGGKRKLSPELGSIIRRGNRAVSARLTGAAVCTDGSFASAGLFSLPEGEQIGEATDAEVTLDSLPEEVRADLERQVREQIANETQSEPNPEEGNALMSNIVPGDQQTHADAPTLNGLFSAIATGDPEQLRHYSDAGALFALNTVQHSGPSGATIGADTQQPGYLGELWSRAPYSRRFVPLVTQKTLTNYTMQGWRWLATPEMADYAGNTAEVPSNVLDTEPVTVTAARLSGGHRLDRRFRDFNDQSVIASYLEKQAEDYKRKTDGKVLAAIMAAATTTAPGTVPSGIAKGLAAIVDGALGVIATENRPAYSIISPELWRDILLTPKDDIFAFLNAGFGLEEGDVSGFRIQPGAVGTGKVITAAKEAVTYYELGETPIRVEGVVPGNGAEDVAVFGYWATLANNAAAVRSVTVQ